MRKAIKTLMLVSSFVVSFGANAAMIELLANGGFESGDFSGWTTADLATSSGNWGVDSDTITDLSGNLTVGPSAGNFYAVTDQGGPGTHILQQSFFVPSGATAILVSFDMFMSNIAGASVVDAIGLDHTGPANQHARVDIMSAGAPFFSTTLADIVANLVAPGSDPVPSSPYTSYSFDLTNILTAGSTYTLRFGETDNQLFFNMGVDNVSVKAEVNRVSAPSALVLLVLSLLGFAVARRRN